MIHPGGSVSLATNNPFDLPKVDPNLMASEFDMLLMKDAIHSVRRFAKAPVWKDYIIAAVDTAETDAELTQFIRDTAQTVSHCVGTAAMSPRGADHGVVDPDLRVKKVVGLRVVDSSVLVRLCLFHLSSEILGLIRFFEANGTCCTYPSSYVRRRREGFGFDQGSMGVVGLECNIVDTPPGVTCLCVYHSKIFALGPYEPDVRMFLRVTP